MGNTSKKALFIGLTTIDIQYFTNQYPAPNTKLKTDAPLIAVGGPAANAAITYSVLGGSADFLTCIGEHQFAQVAFNDLKKYKVNVIDQKAGIESDPIVSAVITTLSNSERTIITHHPSLSETICKPVNINLEKYGLILIDGFYPQILSDILPEANKRNIPVVFDGGSWKDHLPTLLKHIDIAICSANFHPPECDSDEEVVKFLKSFGINEVAISKGHSDIVCEPSVIKVKQVEAVDSLGAGDILHGAFCWFWQQSNNFSESLKNASDIASFSVQYRGTHKWIEAFSKEFERFQNSYSNR